MLAAAAGLARRRLGGVAQLAEAAAVDWQATGGSSAAAAAARQHARAWQRGLAWQLPPPGQQVAAAAGGEAAAALAKARRMAGPLGLLAGVFGSVVGVGGGVIIVPAIVASCKTIPQR